MRILQVCSARTLGGGERHVAAIADALTARGHDVFVALTHDSPLAAELSEVPSSNIISLRMRNALDVPSALKLAKFIRVHRIEIVHAHLARDYPLASLAVRRYAQLVITRHVLFKLNRLHKLTLSRVSRIIAVSNAVARGLQSQHICDNRKIRVVSNGIDLSKFEKPPSEESKLEVRDELSAPRPFLVGALGSMLPIKGHEDFVRAAAIVARARDDVDFVIVGDNEPRNDEHRKQIEQLIVDLGLADKMKVVNWTRELAPFYGALDVYVSTSHSEAFGLSIVEAMACSRAVVATSTEGAQEIIENGVTGLIVPIGDAATIAVAVERLLDNAPERTELGDRARMDVLQRFGLERMIDEIEQVYQEALDSA